MPLPKLRSIDVFPVKVEGEVRFAMRDPYEIQENTMVLSPVAYFIAVHLDGLRNFGDIQKAFSEYFDQQELPQSVIEKVIGVLDENYFLQNERFEQRAKEVAELFRKAIVRPASHSGLVYSSEPGELRAQLASHFKEPEGPGENVSPRKGVLRGLVSPHIDYHRGGPWYARSYQEVIRRETADLYVILGVAHVSPPSPFVLTRKSYQTPLGTASIDADLVNRVSRGVRWDVFEHEMVHRKEHSIEFQAVYLRYCAEKSGKDFKILPILVSGAAGPDEKNTRINQGTQEFLEVLAAELKKYKGSVCLVAGVDLAHIGRRFGDNFDITPDKLSWMEKGDRESIDYVLKKDPAGWYRSIAKDDDARKICGLGALYAFTWLMRELYPESEGSILGYSHAPDPAGGEVSFTSMSFVQ